jgi:hypothetical protein
VQLDHAAESSVEGLVYTPTHRQVNRKPLGISVAVTSSTNRVDEPSHWGVVAVWSSLRKAKEEDRRADGRLLQSL